MIDYVFYPQSFCGITSVFNSILEHEKVTWQVAERALRGERCVGGRSAALRLGFGPKLKDQGTGVRL